MTFRFYKDEERYAIIDDDRGIKLISIKNIQNCKVLKLVAPQGEVEFVVEQEPNLGTPYWTIWRALSAEHFFNDAARAPANALIEETMKVWGCTPSDEDLSDEERWLKTLVKFYKPSKGR
jgi:hypothetical protein